MRRRSKMLRVAKWGGVVTCVLIAAVYLPCIFFYDYGVTDWAGRTIAIRGGATLSAIGIPTAILIYWDRRRRPKPGHCPCGYDLTGNVSGTCPECGQEADHPNARGNTRNGT